MRKHVLGSLTSLLIPFATCGAHTAYAAYQRRQSAQVAGYQPLSSTGQHTLPVNRSSITGKDELDLIAGSQARELIIIDAAVPDKTILRNAARPGIDVVILEAGEDALEQTAALLKNYRNLDALHLVSHGDAGAILLGNHRIDKTGLEAQPGFLAALNAATRAGADLLLYGCELAKDDAGLLELIQQNSHLDIAASNNLTGAAELGGDWVLEIAAGNIETTQPFSSKALQDFSAVLRPFGTKTFEGLNNEYYVDDPSIDWDGFTTYINTPGTFEEVLSSGVNTACGDDLYVSMYEPGSRFYIRSNPTGESFGVTGLSIRTPNSGGHPADTATIFGYEDGNPTPVGTKIGINVTSDTEAAIDLTTGITGSFADIVRLRIAADNAANDEVEFCLMSVDFTPLDSDGSLTVAGGVTEPVGLDTTADTSAEAVNIFDFTLSDGGTSDDQPLTLSQIVVNVSGTATDAERAQITWRLNGPDAGNVTGSYNAGSDTITFSGLSISVADGGSETYTVNTFYNDNTNLTDGHTIVLSVDGDTDLTAGPGGTQMGSTTAVTNGTGTTIDVVATQLAFTTQPAGSVSGNALTTQPEVAARDAFGNIDVDFTETITLTEASAGSLSDNTQAATAGVATFTNSIYTATADQQSFTLTANDQGGVGDDLPAVDANSITADVVATRLSFAAQPAPTTILNGVSTSFTTVPVVSAVDANNAVDTGYSTDIALAEVNGAGSANMNATGDTDANSTTVTITPSNGVATFTGLNITYLSAGGDETFNLRASSSVLTTADSVALTAIANQPPTDIALSSNSVNQSAGIDAVAGTLSTTDPDSGDSHSYSLVAGAGDTHNGSFNISGDKLRVGDAGSLAAGSYSVRIQTEDGDGETFQEAFTITVVDDIAPGVSSVNVPADGTYGPGQNLDFAVNYDEAVTVDTAGGTPRLALTIGATTRYATYLSGSGTSALLFRYTVQSGDSDGDGIALNSTLDNNGGSIRDAAGNNADTNLGAIGSLAGVLVDDGLDTDGDGITDIQEGIDGTDPSDPEDYLDITPPAIAAPADLLIDASGLFTRVTLRQLLGLPANATEEEVQNALDMLASDNIDGADCCGTQAATIASNGGNPRVINSDILWLAPGAHVIAWQGEDNKNNAGTDTQTVRIRPLVSMQKDQIGAEGGPITLRLFLNGLSGSYPLDVPYSIDASSIADSTDHNLVDGHVTFIAGQTQQSVTIELTGTDGVEGDETLVIDLDTTAINAGVRTRHTITITENNLPPDVALDLQQNAVTTALVVTADGDVTVTANVSDPNAGDTHSYDWSETSMQLADTDGDPTDNTFVFDPAPLDPGVYAMRVFATDDNGISDSTTLNFHVVVEAPVLDSATDSDGDGIDDLTEGFGDTDGDGIPNYRDNIATSNVLPVTAAYTDAFLIECDPGLLCRLGSRALSGDDGGAGITSHALPTDQGFNNIGGLFDFEVHQLPVAGQKVRVAIPLLESIPADAVYRKFDGEQWFAFVENANNALHSSAGEMGFCPPPGGADWEPGLVEGHYCVQLTLEDGGPNDSDGLANGSVADPGGLAIPVSSGGSSSSSSSSSGGSASSSSGGSTSSSGGSTSSSGSSASSSGGHTGSWSINGKSKSGGALGLPALLALLSLVLLRNRRRTARVYVLAAALLAPWSQAQESENPLATDELPAVRDTGNAENWWRSFAEEFGKKGYLSLDLHQATGDQKRGEFTSAMDADGVDVSVSNYDVQRLAYQLSLGYRYHPRMAVEFGYLDLGEVDFAFDAEAADAGTLADALADHLPRSAGGWTLANRFDFIFGQWRASANVGLYFWDSEFSIGDPAINLRAKNSTDPLIGLGVAYPLSEQFEAGLQYHRVFLDDQDVELWGLRLSWLF